MDENPYFHGMNRLFLHVFLLMAVLLLSAWGFHAHKLINRMAVFTLPADVSGFYKNHLNYITEHAVDADKRRYVDTLEAARHFIDVDQYGDRPFDSIPVHWTAAVNRFTEQRLFASGILPWQISRTYYRLVRAYSEKNHLRILRYSADIGHYIADAHVPLHTTSNYNGQQTNQVGIHAFWESRLPELFTEEYDFLVGRAHYVASPAAETLRIVEESFLLVDSVLAIEARLHQQFQSDWKYGYVTRNGVLMRTYSEAYSRHYHDALSGMVEDRMRDAIIRTGSFWYSAWIDAGQPDIHDLPALPTETDTAATTLRSKMLGREEWH
ncbi:zinc dependent phospholipase C family protein [Parapedobacter lycopersici]|uniref:zinc dependent phospholipase C family protein n=1 Tax=Parapedobacter lycopersici TaxID=1864939 RepID=UPI003340FF54